MDEADRYESFLRELRAENAKAKEIGEKLRGILADAASSLRDEPGPFVYSTAADKLVAAQKYIRDNGAKAVSVGETLGSFINGLIAYLPIFYSANRKAGPSASLFSIPSHKTVKLALDAHAPSGSFFKTRYVVCLIVPVHLAWKDDQEKRYSVLLDLMHLVPNVKSTRSLARALASNEG